MKLCKIFGHKIPKGWANGAPYFKIDSIVTDGTGTKHAFLYTICDRCNEEYHIGNVHLPTERNVHLPIEKKKKKIGK